jgi:geranylgeranyl pyrophosphate synthase
MHPQIQDDFLDCFGDPEVIGKVGTDIEDAKCCWMVTTALEQADAAQRDVIKVRVGQGEGQGDCEGGWEGEGREGGGGGGGGNGGGWGGRY